MITNAYSLQDALDLLYPGSQPGERRATGGGCISRTEIVKLQGGAGAGESLFLKRNSADLPALFETEAAGLELLKTAFPGGVPEPLAWGQEGNDSFLLMECIESGPPGRRHEEDLGRNLAEMHRSSTPLHGWDRDNFIGSTPQINSAGRTGNSWIDFFREYRLEYQMNLALSRGMIHQDFYNQCDQLLKRLDRLLIEPEVPSLLHGDLWSGNVMTDSHGEAWLIDPAVSYGHREADLAMTEMFGSRGTTFYSSYREAWPLDPGYSDRRDLYNLYHYLNHLNLFGSGYYGSVRTIVLSYL